jgi:hypothetical protein
VLFFNAGESTRRTLAADGAAYTEYAVQHDLYRLLCDEACRDRVAAHWTRHLDGHLSLQEALDRIVADWPE